MADPRDFKATIGVNPPWAEPHPELLTTEEHGALALTAALWNTLCQDIVGTGPTRNQDLDELAAMVHAIQSRILQQAAARAYPNMYRLLGESLGPIGDPTL